MNGVAASLDGENSRTQKQRQPWVPQHSPQDVHAHARLETKRRNVACSRVQRFRRRGLRGKLTIYAIPVADSPPKVHIRTSSARELDETILIERRNATGGRLSSHPIRLIREARGMAAGRDAERCADAAHTRAGDQNLAGDFLLMCRHVNTYDRAFRIAGQRDLLYVEDRVPLRLEGCAQIDAE